MEGLTRNSKDLGSNHTGPLFSACNQDLMAYAPVRCNLMPKQVSSRLMLGNVSFESLKVKVSISILWKFYMSAFKHSGDC